MSNIYNPDVADGIDAIRQPLVFDTSTLHNALRQYTCQQLKLIMRAHNIQFRGFRLKGEFIGLIITFISNAAVLHDNPMSDAFLKSKREHLLELPEHFFRLRERLQRHNFVNEELVARFLKTIFTIIPEPGTIRSFATFLRSRRYSTVELIQLKLVYNVIRQADAANNYYVTKLQCDDGNTERPSWGSYGMSDCRPGYVQLSAYSCCTKVGTTVDTLVIVDSSTVANLCTDESCANLSASDKKIMQDLSEKLQKDQLSLEANLHTTNSTLQKTSIWDPNVNVGTHMLKIASNIQHKLFLLWKSIIEEIDRDNRDLINCGEVDAKNVDLGDDRLLAELEEKDTSPAWMKKVIKPMLRWLLHSGRGLFTSLQESRGGKLLLAGKEVVTVASDLVGQAAYLFVSYPHVVQACLHIAEAGMVYFRGHVVQYLHENGWMLWLDQKLSYIMSVSTDDITPQVVVTQEPQTESPEPQNILSHNDGILQPDNTTATDHRTLELNQLARVVHPRAQAIISNASPDADPSVVADSVIESSFGNKGFAASMLEYIHSMDGGVVGNVKHVLQSVLEPLLNKLYDMIQNMLDYLTQALELVVRGLKTVKDNIIHAVQLLSEHITSLAQDIINVVHTLGEQIRTGVYDMVDKVKSTVANIAGQIDNMSGNRLSSAIDSLQSAAEMINTTGRVAGRVASAVYATSEPVLVEMARFLARSNITPLGLVSHIEAYIQPLLLMTGPLKPVGDMTMLLSRKFTLPLAQYVLTTVKIFIFHADILNSLHRFARLLDIGRWFIDNEDMLFCYPRVGKLIYLMSPHLKDTLKDSRFASV